MLSRGTSDDGFTLVELLVSVALLGLIGAAVCGSFLAMLTVRTSTESGLAVSRDRQFLATLFSDDVADALQVQTGVQPVCGTPVASLLRFSSTDYAPGTTTAVTVTTAWTYDPAARSLVRTSCRGAAAPQRTTVARNVSGVPTLSASCTAAAALTATPAVVALEVPQTGGTPVTLCARRRVA